MSEQKLPRNYNINISYYPMYYVPVYQPTYIRPDLVSVVTHQYYPPPPPVPQTNSSPPPLKTFNGYYKAAVLFVMPKNELDEICYIYNNTNKNQFSPTAPYKLCGLTVGQIKAFPDIKDLITDEMKQQAELLSPNYNYGYDQTVRFLMDHNKINYLNNNLGVICGISLPSKNKMHPNIDLTAICETVEHDDSDIIYTGYRGVYAKTGINLFSKTGTQIVSKEYQAEFRKKYCPRLSYDIPFGQYDKAVRCILIGTNAEDLLKCQDINEELLEELKYFRYDKMVEKVIDD
jgi:hypothetical protein